MSEEKIVTCICYAMYAGAAYIGLRTLFSPNVHYTIQPPIWISRTPKPTVPWLGISIQRPSIFEKPITESVAKSDRFHVTVQAPFWIGFSRDPDVPMLKLYSSST